MKFIKYILVIVILIVFSFVAAKSVSYKISEYKFQQDLKTSMKLQAEWFLKNQKKEGDFYYQRNVQTGEVIRGNNIVRQAAVSFALAEYLKISSEPKVQNAIEKSFSYFLKIAEKPASVSSVLAITYDKKQYSNSNALLLLGLVNILEYAPDKKTEYLDFAIKLADYLLLTQQKSGGYLYTFNPPKEDSYNNGESFYALIRMYNLTSDKRYLVSAQKAAEYFIQRYGIKPIDVAFYSWGMQGFSHLYKVDPQEKYWQFIKSYTEKFLVREAKRVDDYLWSKNNPPSGYISTFLEGTTHVGWLAKDKDPIFYKQVLDYTEKSLKYLLTLQINGPNSERKSKFDFISGSICSDSQCKDVRIDGVGHNLSAMYLYLAFMK